MILWNFILDNLATIIVLLVVLCLLGVVVFRMIRSRSRGCSCGCSDCPMRGKCHTISPSAHNKNEKENG